jgi:hypothetical protein
MNRIAGAVAGAALTLAACSGAQSAVPAPGAQKGAPPLTAEASTIVADNPQCKLFTLTEIAKYIGEPVSPGQNAALGTGCQWFAVDGTGDVIVAVVPSSYHEAPTLAPGYKPLADVGSQGYVAPQIDGWVAGAIVGQDAVRVSAAGATTTETTAVSLLKDTIKRRAS